MKWFGMASKDSWTSSPGAISCGEAGTPEEALSMALADEWDAVVLYLSFAGKSGLEILKELKQIRPRLPVLVLTMHSEEQYARRVFKAGAAGFIAKDSPRAEMLIRRSTPTRAPFSLVFPR